MVTVSRLLVNGGDFSTVPVLISVSGRRKHMPLSSVNNPPPENKEVAYDWPTHWAGKNN